MKKVYIKGDGTEEYGKKIIDYFAKNKVANNWDYNCMDNSLFYNNEGGVLVIDYAAPEGYEEIDLHEKKEENLTLEERVEQLEKKQDEKSIILRAKELEERVDYYEQKISRCFGVENNEYRLVNIDKLFKLKERVEQLETKIKNLK